MEGFVDLRQGGDTAKVNESFWPSFTDIMMVVVMIFMIASAVLILRNWELVEELRATMEAERRAAEAVRFTADKNATLEEQLAQAQHQVSLLRMQLMQAREQDSDKARRLAEQEQQLLKLSAQAERSASELQGATRRLRTLEDGLQKKTAELTQLQTAYSAQEDRLAKVLDDLTSIEQRHREQTIQLAELRQEYARNQQQLVELQGEYDTIKVAYDKLIKPARTAQGKHVVEVRYEKIAGKYRISYRGAGEAEYRIVPRAELETILGGLKAQYPRRLYVKIVIPEDSGLSYSEAWQFTKEMLDRYDYYAHP